MSAPLGLALSASRRELVSVTYRRLRWLEFGPTEAANLTAIKNGLGITPQPWAVRELAHLLFLRDLHRGREQWSDPDDRADAETWTVAPAAEDLAPGQDALDGAPGRAARCNPRQDGDPPDGRITLLSLFRSIAGPDASLDPNRAPAPPLSDPGDGTHREVG
jgi:hypothetical protein